MDSLKYITPLSIFSLAYVTVVIAAKTHGNWHEHAGKNDYGNLVWCTWSLHMFEAWALCVFAFNCHINVVPVAANLIRPTKARVLKISAWVNWLQASFYLLIALTGYLSFLGATDQDILNDYGSKDPLMVLARFMLTLSMLVAIPLNMFPTVRCCLSVLQSCTGQTNLMVPSPQPTPAISPEASPNPARQGFDNAMLEPPSDTKKWPRILCATVLSLCSAGVAVFVPGVATILGLLGGSLSTFMMLWIPAFLIGKLCDHTTGNLLKQVILYALGVCSFVSVPLKIVKMCGVDY